MYSLKAPQRTTRALPKLALARCNASAKNPVHASPVRDAVTSTLAASLAAVVLTFSSVSAPPALAATDAAAVGKCLLSSCQVQLAKCLGDVGCLQNLVCLQGCTGKPDEVACQIRCGDLYADKAVDTFNCCAVSDANCVPQTLTEDAYPVPPVEALVPEFNTADFTGRWYITAGYNKLFDTFDCQEHFFTSPEPGKLFGKINWRISKGDGAFIPRSTVQAFVQDPARPSNLANRGNEYLHYEDDWYVVSWKPEEYAFIYYKGNNDAWRGYGGATVYTRASQFPTQYTDEMRRAAESVGLKWEDFTITDNTCPPPPPTAGLLSTVGAELEKDLKSFGRGFTVLESELVDELTKEEKLLEEEIAQATKKLVSLEKSYEDKGFFGFKFPWAR